MEKFIKSLASFNQYIYLKLTKKYPHQIHPDDRKKFNLEIWLINRQIIKISSVYRRIAYCTLIWNKLKK
ncbi:hypothetical protein BpHYR1_028147 [Brachionus plicatilis]|uniref:Uncharacterized protein n=1 Tax=Brachionus plicatilis TaxID=10195 RepID=A0A3M7PN99_BRAPC|nr:hypothetical protein BpHYR1_028147 [Brachionus plicatilis]